MSADMPDSDLSRPARRPQRQALRSLHLQTAVASQHSEAGFLPAADQPNSDADILKGYQVFLGRDPENSFVINQARGSTVRAFIRGLLTSAEFRGGVAGAITRFMPMPHDRTLGAPDPSHADWLARLLVMPEPVRTELQSAATWRDFWRALAGLKVIAGALSQVPAAAEAQEEAAESAPAGIVMITVDQPKAGESVYPGAFIMGSGWAIAPDDIVGVSVLLDDLELAHAQYGLPRPDVARNFPHYRHVDHCGFAFSVQVPADVKLKQNSLLHVTVRTQSGITGRKSVRIAVPAQEISPDKPPMRLFVEDTRVDDDGTLRLRGWALSLAHITRIGIWLGDTPLGDADLGLERRDIAETYGDYPDAAKAGFIFYASLRDHAPGAAALRVQALDGADERRQVIIPVTIPHVVTPPPEAAAPAEAPADAGVRFHCDLSSVQPDGTVSLSGWALSPAGITAIIVSAGGVELGRASLGGTRTDVARAYPGVAGAAESGFSVNLRAEDPSLVPAGGAVSLIVCCADGREQTIQVELVGVAGVVRDIPVMRLEIDQPLLAEGRAATPVRGALTVAGWAVAPEGIGDIVISCDDMKLGEAYLGMRREDIARAFPDCTDSLFAGFALVLPPGALAEGPHTLRVLARSRNGSETDTRFDVLVEAPDEVLPGSAPRTRMPRAERAFYEATLRGRQTRPQFAVSLLPGIRAGKASAGAQGILSRTLRSLAAQAYQDFVVTIHGREGEARERAEALIRDQYPELAGRVACDERPPLDTGPGRPLMLTSLHEGDVLGVDALLELALAHAITPEATLIYADDYRWDAAHDRRSPFHKPDWSPELLLGMDYLGRPWCVPDSVRQAAGLSSDVLSRLPAYDAALRLTEHIGDRPVIHINKVLASLGEADGDALQALREAAVRRGQEGEVIAGTTGGTWRLKRAIVKPGLVSIIMPTAGSRDLVRQAIQSIRATTAPGAVEFVLLDNVPASEKKMKSWLRKNAEKVIDIKETFNWSRFNNIGAAQASGDYLLFLNDDIEAGAPGWLEALLEHAQLPDVGVVGARLLYPDGKVQHAGQYIAESHARHFFRFAAGSDPGPFGLGQVAREMSAVTGACMLMRREVFQKLGGFDEAHDVVNNDLDFCLRARGEGLRVMFTPHLDMMHHELASRAKIEDSFDAARFSGAWRLTMQRGDPYHSRRLLADADHMAPDPEPVLPVHAGPAGPDLASIRKILAVKLDHIGDYLTSLPALALLKSSFPDAKVSLLAPPATAALARSAHVVDEVIEFTFFHARSGEGKRSVTEGEYESLAARLVDEKFDMAIDLRMHPDTRKVLQHSGAQVLVGYDHQGTFPWLDVALEWEGDLRLQPKHAHVVDRMCQLVLAARDACRALPEHVPEPADDPRSVPALAKLPAAFLERRLVCMHPGVGNPVRQWPPGSYATLVDLLAEDGLNVVLIGGPDEVMIGNEVMSRVTAKLNVVSLVGAVKLGELPPLMRACAIFIGNNSGPKHLAASLGVPVLGIHSGVVDAFEWAPLGGAAMALQRKVICGPCYLEFATDCPRNMACLTGIKARDVMAAVRRLLALRPPREAEAAEPVARATAA
jgi:ADP-heptose:LPS heptosyltransferase/GT2 family glycosyltransferase